MLLTNNKLNFILLNQKHMFYVTEQMKSALEY